MRSSTPDAGDRSGCRRRGSPPPLRQRRDAGHPPRARRQGLPLRRARRQARSATRDDAAAHPRARDPAGVDRRLDLPASPTATSRRPAATRAAASSTATTRAGARSATRRSTTACSPSRQALPRIRAARRDATWRCPGLPREKVLAAVVRLLETTLIRVGNEEYARAQRLLRPDDAARPARRRSTARRVRFHFRGKSGVRARDRRRRPPPRAHRQALPGPAGPGAVPVRRRGRRARTTSTRPTSTSTCARSPARSSRRRTSAPGRARCWRRRRCRSSRRSTPQAQAKQNVVQAIEAVAERLGNTPAVCRKCYVHPAVIEAYLDGERLRSPAARSERSPPKSLPRPAARGGGGAGVPAPLGDHGCRLRLLTDRFAAPPAPRCEPDLRPRYQSIR